MRSRLRWGIRLEDHLLIMQSLRGAFHNALFLIAGGAGAVYAGSSLVTTTAKVVNSSVPSQNQNAPWRLEFAIHDWGSPVENAHPCGAQAIGLNCEWLSAGTILQLTTSWDIGGLVCRINQLGSLPVQFIYVRYQRDPSTKTETCEGWDIHGTKIDDSILTYSSNNTAYNFAGVEAGGADASSQIAFFRIHHTLLSANSRPPVTADNSNTLVHWKFDNSLADASGNGYTGSAQGSVSYASTPGQTLVVAFPKTAAAPQWSNWVSLRAGRPNRLDAAASYSQADASPNVSYQWSQLAGPTVLRWSNKNIAQPVVTGAVFGTYRFRLTVTDMAGNTDREDLEVGAVATDDKGVVINADPRVDQLFGPMIAFGRNPWGFADERHLAAVNLQNTFFLSGGWDHPTWSTPGQGTVSYPFRGKGPAPGASCTSLASSVTAAETEIVVSDASCLSLASLPTWIFLGNTAFSGTSHQEVVRICSTTGTTGQQTLTVCYNGRELTSTYATVAAQAWPAGTLVGELRIAGTGTQFASDPQSPLCPAGAPGPPGAVVYAAGSVTLSPGSTTVTGTGTAWNNNPSVTVGDMIRIVATHGGDSFVFWSTIQAIPDATHLTLSRAAPSDIDGAAFPYKITRHRWASLEFTGPEGAKHNELFYTIGCESETSAYAFPYYEAPAVSGTQTGQRYSFKDGIGAAGTFGPNFYGSGLALRSFYYRSGLTLAKTASDRMDEHWIKDPELGGGHNGGLVLAQGGGVIGAIADLVTNPATTLSWNDVRTFVSSGNIGAVGCNNLDTRDSGYLGAWLILGAVYDPDPVKRGVWKTAAQSLYTRDVNCKGSDNSWANGFYFNSSSPALTVTQGSKIVSGTGLAANLCHGIASGQVRVQRGSAAIFGTGLVNGAKIVIAGSRNGQDYSGAFAFTQTAGAQGTLAALWPGDSGTFPYIIEDSASLSTLGQHNDDPQLGNNWACIWNSSTQLTLHREWKGPSGSGYHIYTDALAGKGQQPFMLGIKLHGLTWAQNIDSPVAASYAALRPLAARWVRDIGYDPNTQGMHYGRIFSWCEPFTTSTPATTFSFRQGECSYGNDPNFVRASRVLAAETSSALRSVYESDSSPLSLDWGDRVYGSIWGHPSYTAPGFYSDALYVKDENSNISLASYKWPGFFFGMGMAHQWPAARLGGAAPPRNRPVYIDVNQALAPQIRILLTAPSGAVTTYPCTGSPCTVQVDDRQGSHWFQIQYLAADGKILTQTEPDLLAGPPGAAN